MGDQETNKGAEERMTYIKGTQQNLDSILKLNDDFIVNIFQYLSVKEKVIVRRVCKRFSKLSVLSWSNAKDWIIHTSKSYYGEESIPTKIFLNQILDQCGLHLKNISFFCHLTSSTNNEKTNKCSKCPKVLKRLSFRTGNVKYFSYGNCNIDAHREIDDDLKMLFLNNPSLDSLHLSSETLSGQCFSSLPFSSIKELDLKLNTSLEAEFLKNSFSLFKVLKKFTFHANESTLKIMTVMLETLSKNSNVTEDLQVCVYLKPEEYRYDGYLDSQDVGKIFLLKKNLRTLSLRKVMVNVDFLSNLEEDSNIEKIYFNDCNVAAKDLLHYLPKFKNLCKFELMSNVIDDSYINAISLCQNLRYLTLNSKPKIRIQNFCYLENLEYLQINTEVLNDNLLADIGKCKQLKTLMLTSFYQSFTDFGLIKISHLSKLEYLSFGVADHVTDKSLSKFVQLKKLFLHDCNGIRDEGLCTLIKNSSNLEVLDVDDCKNITNKLIEFAINHKNIVKGKVLNISAKSTKVKVKKINISSPFVKVVKSFFSEECLNYDNGD